MKTLNPAVARVLKRLHYPLDVIPTCVRWYVAYPLSLRHLEEMMAERGISVDHSTVHRWAIKVLPVLEKEFRHHKRAVGRSWRMDETYIKVRGQWKYLYRAPDKQGNTVDFLLRAHRDKVAAQRYFEKSSDQNGEPETVTASDAGLQEFSLRSHPVKRHRACAYDRQGSNERQLHRAQSRWAILLGGSISNPQYPSDDSLFRLIATDPDAMNLGWPRWPMKQRSQSRIEWPIPGWNGRLNAQAPVRANDVQGRPRLAKRSIRDD
jgi:putative transposase